MAVSTTPRGYIERPRPSGLADVIDVILDKGLVIDAYVRVALIGIEILTIDARIVIASVDTYLRLPRRSTGWTSPTTARRRVCPSSWSR